MDQDWYFQRLEEYADRVAFVYRDRDVPYGELVASAASWTSRLRDEGVRAGDVVAVVSEFSPTATAAMLALARLGAVAVPLTNANEEKLGICGASLVVDLLGDGDATFARTGRTTDHPLVERLRAEGHPGIVLFTSGSTGVPQGLLIDFVAFVERFRRPRPALRTLTLLMFDHIGGITTLFGILGYGGTAVMASVEPGRGKRALDPDVVCELVQRHGVQLLPGSPTFLRMLLVSDAHKRFDLSSLLTITYGTEPMYPATLRDVSAAFPKVTLKQTYGSSETGILQTRTVDRDSLWITIGGPGVETKVVGGQLLVRAPTAMLGYLNAPSPFDAEGWYNTGDQVEQDGDKFLIRGRVSEIINVGGEKVFPAEVEAVLLQAPNVDDATVYGRRSPVTGHVVAARVTLLEPEPAEELSERLQAFCAERLAGYKVPVFVQIADAIEHVNGKKRRTAVAS